MKTELKDYLVRDGHAGLRKKLVDILDFALRGLKCNTETACNGRNGEYIRLYHEGKAQAYMELLTFFECYLKENDDED